jgi:hypothetical protein
MSRSQFAAFLAVAFAGCFFGGLLARLGPESLQAQVVPSNPRQVPGIRNEDVLFVPNGGLRIVDENNRLLGWLGEQGGGTSLVLMDSAGRPSVSVLAGPAGQAVLSGQGSASLRLSAGTGNQVVAIESGGSGPSVHIGNLVTLAGTGDGGRIVVSDRQGRSLLRLESSAEGGRLTGNRSDGKSAFEMAGGSLTLRSPDGRVGFQAVAGSHVSVAKGDKTLFRAPSEE